MPSTNQLTRQARFLLVLLLAAGCTEQAPVTEQAAVDESDDLTWQVLFDGGSLDGWEPRGDAQWTTEDDYVTVVPGTGDGFLTTTDEYADFRMQVEFWADETANGGIYLRVPSVGPEINPSYEVNIMDTHADWPTGSINGVARNDDPDTVGRWNTFDITLQGDRVTVLLNDSLVADGEAERSASGPVALQKLGEGTIRYRNVRIAPL